MKTGIIKKSKFLKLLKFLIFILISSLISILIIPKIFVDFDESYDSRKLYWRNETSLHIDKIREEIKNYKN